MTFAIPSLPGDQANHFMYGALVAATVTRTAEFIPPHLRFGLEPRDIGLAAAVIVGAIKEGADAFLNWRATGNPMRGPHGVEWGDFLATCAGGAVVWAAA